ncbi:MAG: hypothetical protein KME10_19690 [Plectolyngbya sp. WJT66-NPBG17]|jgi:hypothetical protein|nr:hypothetical protein [Plectolyngbya sp. WJT66-NPBG17]
MSFSGRTTSITNRFPKFYLPEDQNDDFYRLMGVFAAIVEQAETDLEQVLRSRFVSTAENTGSQGFTAVEKGDLDRIFVMYLERLGSTSQLKQVNPNLQASDILQLDSILESFAIAQSPFQAVWDQRSTKLESLIQRYDVSNTKFLPNLERAISPSLEGAKAWLLKLLVATDPLTAYLRSQFSDQTLQGLNAYDGSTPDESLIANLTETLNQKILPDRTLAIYFQDRTEWLNIEIQLWHHLNELDPLALPGVAQYLYGWLSPSVQRSLYDLDDQLSYPIQSQLLSEFRSFVSDLRFLRQLDRYASIEITSPCNLQQTCQAFLKTQFQQILTTNLSQNLGASLPFSIAALSLPEATQTLLKQTPKGADLYRLNRLLLEAAYPQELPQSEIPTALEVCQAIAQFFNQKIQTDQNFRSQLEAVYPTQIEKSDAPYRERLQRLITVLKNGASTCDGIVDVVAANLGMSPDRVTGSRPWETLIFHLPLIQESFLDSLRASPGLRSSFVKQAGIQLSLSTTVIVRIPGQEWQITDAIASRVFRVERRKDNFAVYEQLIRVVEFVPNVSPSKQTIYPVHLLQLFNPNPSPTAPNLACSIQDPFLNIEDELILNLPNCDLLKILNHQESLPPELYSAFGTNRSKIAIAGADTWQIKVYHVDESIETYQVKYQNQQFRFFRNRILPPLRDFSLRDTNNQEVLRYTHSLHTQELFEWSPEGRATINSVPVPPSAIVGALPEIASGGSEWQIAADVTSEVATLDRTLLDFCCFEQEKTEPLNPEQAALYAIQVQSTFYKFTPGQFTVRIPWDIPGYSDRFNETLDHPRHQIHILIEKIRATGISSVIVYEKHLSPENQNTQDQFSYEEQDITQTSDFSNTHDITESLLTCAVFDYSYFDSLNGLG